MKNRFLTYSETLLTSADKVLLTLSGGIDSMVMLHLFRQSSFNIGIAHCNFQLRGKEADADELFVKETAEKANIPFFSVRFDTKTYARNQGISIQMAARELRYAWFQEIALKNDFTFIATAHHRDDVLETFFVNMLRKTGIKGLIGIKAKNANIVRPLLNFSRQDIQEYAEANHILYREDESNKSDYYTRNYIRHHIIPEFRKLQDNFDEALSDTIHILSNQEAIYNLHVKNVKQQIMKGDDSMYAIDIQNLIKLSKPNVYLFECIYPFGFNASQTDNILSSLNNASGKLFISETHSILKDRDKLFIRPNLNNERNQPQCIENTFVNDRLEHATLSLRLMSYHQDFCFEKRLDIAYFDAAKIKYPLIVRKWEQGDIFYPFGMKGKKKLSDFFTDNKISIFEKETIDILCNGNGDILWIIGLRSDNRYKITPQTKNILKIMTMLKEQ
ncbi:MAG: tRNA lysidine(34) synthetase TilS [Bacteroidales bacterium]|jgi:tRNA(Ile)-lysidine synthase|nr:tRNA lysidine(34) synthetase TilS [Bacteroidales bacterium]